MSHLVVPQKGCDVAVVGAGPVGMMTACLVKALNKDLTVKVFDKRPTTTRDHALRIKPDSISKIHALCQECLARSSSSLDKPLIEQLLFMTTAWKNRHVRTSKIEEALTQIVKEKIEVLRGPEYEVRASAFSAFLASTNAPVVIGADGAADSQVREAMGGKKNEEKPLSYLLELKYNTTQDSLERNSIDSSTQAVVAEGWDFETMGRKEADKELKRVTLHKFVDLETHRALLLVDQAGGVSKGSTANPWTMEELSEQANKDSKAKWVVEHIHRYFNERDHSGEKIVTFPMTMFRSTQVVKMIGNQVVVLAGDASAGVVLERGVNKGFIEAALCAKAVVAFFEKKPAIEKINSLPQEFTIYEQETLRLYKNERWWAEWKAFGLRASEVLLAVVVKPFKWTFKGFQVLGSRIRAVGAFFFSSAPDKGA